MSTKVSRRELGWWKNAFLGAIYQRDTQIAQAAPNGTRRHSPSPFRSTPIAREQRKPPALPSVSLVNPREIT